MKFLALLVVIFACTFLNASVFAQKPELVVQTGHSTDLIFYLAFSPDGKMLASAGFFDPNVKIWHIETGKELTSINFLKNPLFFPQTLGWKKQRLYLSFGGGRSGIVQYEFARKKIELLKPTPYIRGIRNAAYNPDYSLICYASDSTAEKIQDSIITKKDSVRIIEVSTGTIKATLPVSGKTTASFSNDGKFIITNTNEKRTSLWDANTFSFIRSLPIDADKISLEAISPDSQKLSFHVNDTTIQVFGMQSNEVLATMKGHKL
jgi:WD40 repeat protein